MNPTAAQPPDDRGDELAGTTEDPVTPGPVTANTTLDHVITEYLAGKRAPTRRSVEQRLQQWLNRRVPYHDHDIEQRHLPIKDLPAS